MTHNPGLLFKDGLVQAVCPCGWTSGDFQPPWNRQQVLDAEREHWDLAMQSMNPVVAAKIDELVETGNKHGVTAELVQDVISLIGEL